MLRYLYDLFFDLDLVDIIAEYGLPIDRNGMCFGIALMGLQAILLKDTATLHKRLNLLRQIPHLDTKNPPQDQRLFGKNEAQMIAKNDDQLEVQREKKRK